MMKQSKRWTSHCNLVLGATGMILMTIAGCGGGGGGSRKVVAPTTAPTNIPSADPQPTPTATPVPTALPTPVPQPDGSCPINPDIYRPNYAAELLAGYSDPAFPNDPQPPGELLRHARFPLRVYFNINADLTDARRAYAIQGFNQWVAGTNNRVKYSVITNKAQADVVVTFSPYDPVADDMTLGIARLSFDPTTKILFEFFQDTRPNVPDEQKAGHLLLNYTGNLRTDTTTAAHEFGHILGIGGHSPNNLDQMYFANNPSNSGNVTPADLNTLRTAYCDNFPQLTVGRSAGRTTTNSPVRTIVIKDTVHSLGIHSH